MKFSGFVTAFEKDKSGNIIQVSIEDDLFNRYIIVNDDISSGLFRLINKKVSISGEIVDHDIKGRPVLVVKKILKIK